ncbi:MAG: nicotinate-nucleotide adenylyltransferase [Chloroflexi bacterium]|nr:nicotinate-nucleotide adenylyltransferase [Chloroflexota bacterium]
MKRLGILGGTFDPVHLGHLAIAEEARVRLGLSSVVFIPAREPPHKTGRPLTAAQHRLTMLELAIASNPSFQISTLELERPGLSFTVDTLQAFRERESEDTLLHFIAGTDALHELTSWHQPRHILQLCTFVVVHRPGVDPPDIKELTAALPELATRLLFVEGPRFDLSATELRKRIRRGLPIRYQVPEEVREYIERHGLYRC